MAMSVNSSGMMAILFRPAAILFKTIFRGKKVAFHK
jgi:hypothetical protein